MNTNNDESKKSSKNAIFLFMFALVVIGLFSVASSGIFNMPNLYTTLAFSNNASNQNITSLDYVYANYFVGDGSGLTDIPVPSRVGFSAKNSLIVIPGASWTTATFNTELDDINNDFNLTEFTVPTGEGGIYSISGAFVFASVTDGNIYIVGISVNDKVGVSYILGRGTSGATGLAGAGGSLQVPLNAGDTIKLQAYSQNPTTGFNLDGYQTFSAYKISG